MLEEYRPMLDSSIMSLCMMIASSCLTSISRDKKQSSTCANRPLKQNTQPQDINPKTFIRDLKTMTDVLTFNAIISVPTI